LGAVLPAFQFFIFFVELSQKFIALIGHFEGLLGGRFLYFSGLDNDLRLHADLRVFILHDDDSGLFPCWGYLWCKCWQPDGGRCVVGSVVLSAMRG
jgi:hypothetical protein